MRRNRSYHNQQLKDVWNQRSEKKLRVFNQQSNNIKGKIKIDGCTFVEYDYSGDQSKTVLRKKDQFNHIDKDKFELPKYPVLRKIVTEIPKNTDYLHEMDLFLMKDLDEALLWKNQRFEFHT